MLDYAQVHRYWDEARPSILGPYMMDGFGFPTGAGRFRFRAEARMVGRLIRGLNHDGTVLDLGSGIGCWTEYFATRFARVVCVEGSRPLYEALQERCATLLNVKSILGDVMLFQPEDRYELIFLGGLLMYLNESDVVSLLQKLTPSLQPGGMILCRETTVRKATETREGDYQVVYRSTATYQRIFTECGLTVAKVQMNRPYVLMQMGCEFIRKWKTLMPQRLQLITLVGHLMYGGLRLGYPWIVYLAKALRIPYPQLTNHFFELRAGSSRER